MAQKNQPQNLSRKAMLVNRVPGRLGKFLRSRFNPPKVRRLKVRTMNFDRYANEGNRFINEVAFDLGSDHNHAARVTKAVLHAVRDRLTPDDAVQFAQGLPMALKSIFVDQYDISATPVTIRNGERFLEFIRSKGGRTAAFDFPNRRSVLEALQSVFFVLENHMDEGQIDQVKNAIGKELVALIYEEA